MIAQFTAETTNSEKVIYLLPPLCGSFRRAAPFVEQFIILFNKIILNRGQLKDRVILDIKQCYLNINYVRQFFLVQAMKI